MANLAIGTKINRWTVIGDPVSSNGRKHYPCRCDCGWEQKVRSDNLQKGHSNSHKGCPLPRLKAGDENFVAKEWQYKAETARSKEEIYLKNSYIGSFFGDLLAIDVAHSDSYGHTFYLCVNCKTGATSVHRYDHLTRSYGFPDGKHNAFKAPVFDPNDPVMKDCGGSMGERAIETYLEANHLSYEREATFDDLRGQGSNLRFDFKTHWMNKTVLIEFQGRQHYEPIEFFGGQPRFELQQKYDDLKRNYCKRNNYILIEIPYTDIDNISRYLDFLHTL